MHDAIFIRLKYLINSPNLHFIYWNINNFYVFIVFRAMIYITFLIDFWSLDTCLKLFNVKVNTLKFLNIFLFYTIMSNIKYFDYYFLILICLMIASVMLYRANKTRNKNKVNKWMKSSK